MSLNPPLLLTNYCMNPLELFEIDDPHGLPVVRSQSRIPPSKSDYIIQLDLTNDNESHIKLQITDTVKNMKMSTVIEKLGIESSTKVNTVDKNLSQDIRSC